MLLTWTKKRNSTIELPFILQNMPIIGQKYREGWRIFQGWTDHFITALTARKNEDTQKEAELSFKWRASLSSIRRRSRKQVPTFRFGLTWCRVVVAGDDTLGHVLAAAGVGVVAAVQSQQRLEGQHWVRQCSLVTQGGQCGQETGGAAADGGVADWGGGGIQVFLFLPAQKEFISIQSLFAIRLTKALRFDLLLLTAFKRKKQHTSVYWIIESERSWWIFTLQRRQIRCTLKI